MITILAWFGALSLTTCSLILVWAALVLYLRHRHHKAAAEFVAALYEAIDRHPAGSRLDYDSRPWGIPAPCCGGTIYGDSLRELLINREYHESVCPRSKREAA